MAPTLPGDDSGAQSSLRPFNVNVGILGHVDSGKTSLVRALSTELSTAALDKHPQSQERGMTLDLGFSAFRLPVPEHWREEDSLVTGQGQQPSSSLPYDGVQFTLVDCPGHASLIRTIIGGAQIIDLMILVVDVTKGIQAQTAECLIIGEILSNQLIVVLNKIDLLSEEDKEEALNERKEEIRRYLAGTKFTDAPIVALSAAVGGEESIGKAAAHTQKTLSAKRSSSSSVQLPATIGVDGLLDLLSRSVKKPEREKDGSFLFSVDHCFQIKGKGTILTGTVLQGAVKVTKKVKSMQMFHKSVTSAHQGDRVGLCVAGLDPSALERGLACSPDTIYPFYEAVAVVERVPAYKGKIRSKAKFHLSVGHATVMARVIFFSKAGGPRQKEAGDAVNPQCFSYNDMEEYEYQDEGFGELGEKEELTGGGPIASRSTDNGPQLVLLQLEQPIFAPSQAIILASKLDMDTHLEACRIAFHGRLLQAFSPSSSRPVTTGGSRGEELKLLRYKERVGVVQRISTKAASETVERKEIVDAEVIVDGLFGKETDLSQYLSLQVVKEGERAVGRIVSSFGKTGKVKVLLPSVSSIKEGDKVLLPFKKYMSVHQQGKKRKNGRDRKIYQDEKTVSLCAERQRLRCKADRLTETLGSESLDSLKFSGIKSSERVMTQKDREQEQVMKGRETEGALRGIIERLKGETTSDGRNPMAICSGLFGSAEEAECYIGKMTETELGEQGTITATFGKAGKVRVSFEGGTLATVGCAVQCKQALRL